MRTAMNKQEMISRFEQWEKKTAAYRYAEIMMGLDANALPPASGSAARNEWQSVFAEEAFRIQNDPDIYALISRLLKEEDLDHEMRRKLQLHARSLGRSLNIPAAEYGAYRRALAESEQAWLKYKKEKNYAGYAPYLEKLVNAFRALSEKRACGENLFDYLLEENEEGWNREKYDAFFAEVRNELVPLIKEIAQRPQVRTDFLKKPYDPDRQRIYMQDILQYIGFTADWGKLSESEHPLTTCVCSGDIRFTTKYRPYDGAAAVLSSVHEGGHAWFGHNVNSAYDGTILAEAISAGLHESQSRLCENHLGRSLAFWQANYPGLQKMFPENLQDISLETFWQGMNAVQPSLIRTEADELTYPLHIMIRYEIEKEIFDSHADIRTLNKLWNRKYKEYLGVDVPDDEAGILQDMHWPYAYFGYFPTYALGSARAAQFYAAMCRDIDPDALLRQNRFAEIMAWLKEHVHQYGALYTADEIVEKATGEPFTAKYYTDYLKQKYSRIYGL